MVIRFDRKIMIEGALIEAPFYVNTMNGAEIKASRSIFRQAAGLNVHSCRFLFESKELSANKLFESVLSGKNAPLY